MPTELENQQAAVGEHLRTDERLRRLEQDVTSLRGKCKRLETRVSELQRKLDAKSLRQRVAELVTGG